MSIPRSIAFLRSLPKFPTSTTGLSLGAPSFDSPLEETSFAGSNPGNLRMFSYVPPGLEEGAALVVVLHGCTQSAQGYDVGAGWSTLAQRYGFALLMPEQQTANNPKGCFNWFEPQDTRRDSGEALSIRQMIEQMVRSRNVDESRIFVTGLSAGGAMTSVMLATYPDVFAGGAIIAGLPFGAAENVQQALRSMFTPAAHTPQQLGDLVRQASPHRGPWPKVSVWHGSADRTVSSANAGETIKQWLDVHGLPLSPTSRDLVDSYPREIWRNADGDTVVESYTITNMMHGTPLGAGDDNEQFGVEGAFLIDAGISSSFHIAAFFGLTERVHTARPAVKPQRASHSSHRSRRPSPVESFARTSNARDVGGDIGEVIGRALKAAGLMR